MQLEGSSSLVADDDNSLTQARADVARVVELASDVVSALWNENDTNAQRASEACEEAVEAIGRVKTTLRTAAVEAQTHVGGAAVLGRRDVYASKLELHLAKQRAKLLANQMEGVLNAATTTTAAAAAAAAAATEAAAATSQ